MSIFQFWTDPVGWLEDQYTWFITDPPWFVIANLAFWPALFAKAWLLDWRDARRKRKRALAARLPS